MQVVSYSIATTKSLKDRETGEWKENTEWHRCVSFNKTAEHIGMNVEPGDLLFLEGELRTRKWQTQSGEDRYTTEIVVNDFPRKLPKYFSKNGSQQAAPAPQPQQQAHASPSQPGHLEQPPVEAYGFDDDYPF
ncbi:single-stranded DNA-binding protein [Marinobacter sp. C18]|nr:single-stranded DNA-binding protein [Marinobacter sp. C18]